VAKRKRKQKPQKRSLGPGPKTTAGTCAACGEAIPADEALARCGSCDEDFHKACWAERDQCPGCLQPTAGLPGWVEAVKTQLARPWSAPLLLLALVAVFYWNAFGVPFLFDDAPVVTRNRLLWQWDTAGDLVRRLPTRSLTNLSFLINFQLAKTPTVQAYEWWHPWSYHLVSLVLHLLNGLLLFTLVRDLLGTREWLSATTARWVALAGAALWLVHPANTMAVSYVAQRYALMATLAFLGTLVLYVRLRRRIAARDPDGAAPSAEEQPAVLRDLARLALLAAAPLALAVLLAFAGAKVAAGVVFVFGALGVLGFTFLSEPARVADLLLLAATVAAMFTCFLTKENAAVIPAAIVLVELFFFRGPLLRRLAVVTPFLVVFFGGILIRMNQVDVWRADGLGDAFERFFPDSPTSGHWQYFLTQVYVVPRYLHLFLLPYDLSVEQNFPPLYGEERVAAWSAFFGGEGALAMDDWRYLLAVLVHPLLWALAVKLFVRGHRFVPFAIAWFYVTNVVESSFVPILDPMVDHRMYLPTALLPAAFAVAFARAWPTIARGRPWAHAATLAGVAVLVASLGVGTLLRNKTWSSATGIWRDTVEKRPNCARAYSSLGMEHLYDGEWRAAIEPIEAALYLGPYHVEGWNNLGKAYLELQRWDLAEQALTRGIDVNRYAPSPSIPLCWNNLGLVYIQVATRTEAAAKKKELLLEASGKLEQAVRLDRDYEVAWINLATSEFYLVELSRGEARQRHAENVIQAVNAAEGVARRRRGALPRNAIRARAVALGVAGHAQEAVEHLGALIANPSPRHSTAEQRSERITLVEDTARVAVMAGDDLEPGAQRPLLRRAADLLDENLEQAAPASSIYLRADVAEALGDVEGAVRFMKLGLQAQPDHPRAMEFQARLKALQKRLGGASPERG